MFKRRCKITFITHGATVYSLEGIINNDSKYPKINEIGEEEIEKVCEYLKKRGVSYDKIYTTPKACCIETANIIAKLFRQKSIVVDLKNRNYGKWHGLSALDLIKEHGVDFLSQTPENGEALKDFNNRINNVIEALVKENKGSRIIVVTTPDVVRAVIAQTLGLTPKYQHKILIKTGSLTQISYFEQWSSLIYSDYIPL